MTLPRQRGLTEQAADAAIDSACRMLRLPSIRKEFPDIAERALKEQMSYRGFLAELLMAECDDRARRHSATARWRLPPTPVAGVWPRCAPKGQRDYLEALIRSDLRAATCSGVAFGDVPGDRVDAGPCVSLRGRTEAWRASASCVRAL